MKLGDEMDEAEDAGNDSARSEAYSESSEAALRPVTLLILGLSAAGCVLFPAAGILVLYERKIARSSTMTSCTQYGVPGASLAGQNPFEVDFHGLFWRCSAPGSSTDGCQAANKTVVRARGFYHGDSTFTVRFSPPEAGVWGYAVSGALPELSQAGTLLAAAAPPGEHGPVRAVGKHFVHADGTPHFSLGTTCYAWAHQTRALRQATLDTLRGAPGTTCDGRGRPFNKLRMTIFPKWYVFNHEEPATGTYPFEGMPPTQWDHRRFSLPFWEQIETRVGELHQLGVIADLILFHPYDEGHWGFDCLGGNGTQSGAQGGGAGGSNGANGEVSRQGALPDEGGSSDGDVDSLYPGYNVSDDVFYLRYAVARLGAFSNVWWSMANEFDFVNCKGQGVPDRSVPVAPIANESVVTPVWDSLLRALVREDPYGRLTSIHNGRVIYSRTRVGKVDIPFFFCHRLEGRVEETAEVMGGRFGVKPVVWDEVKYEGDIQHAWGALSGQEMTDRFWWGYTLGAYVGHAETILQPYVRDDDQVMWWSKGGELRGAAPERISWFRDYATGAETPPFHTLQPWAQEELGCGCTCNALVEPGEFALFRLVPDPPFPGVQKRPVSYCNLSIPGTSPSSRFRVTAIDWWKMISEVKAEEAQEKITVKIGGWNIRSPHFELRRLPDYLHR